MKPPAWRMDLAAYPHHFDMQTRYSDQDTLGHVNNIAVAAYHDEARARLMRHIFTTAGDVADVRIVTAESRVSYRGEVFHPDPVQIGSGLLKIGTASFTIGQTLFQNGRCVGLAETVLVQASTTGSEPIHPKLRAVMETLMVREG